MRSYKIADNQSETIDLKVWDDGFALFHRTGDISR